MGTAVETTIYTYVDLHSVARMTLASERRRKYEKYECAVATLVFSAFFLEGYLNFVGSQVLPEWSDKFERETKPKAKLKQIAKKLGYTLNAKSSEYESFITLFRLRNSLAHAKLETLKSEKSPLSARSNQIVFLQAEWEQVTSSGRFRKLYEDAENLVKGLHQKFRPDRDPFAISAESTY